MTKKKQDRFDEALKSWGAQPPRTPADEAARQVMEQLPERRRGAWFTAGGLRLATAAAGLVLLLVVGWVTIPRGSGPLSPVKEVALPPLSEDVLLLWLDDETPLYLTVTPPGAKGGS